MKLLRWLQAVFSVRRVPVPNTQVVFTHPRPLAEIDDVYRCECQNCADHRAVSGDPGARYRHHADAIPTPNYGQHGV